MAKRISILDSMNEINKKAQVPEGPTIGEALSNFADSYSASPEPLLEVYWGREFKVPSPPEDPYPYTETFTIKYNGEDAQFGDWSAIRKELGRGPQYASFILIGVPKKAYQHIEGRAPDSPMIYAYRVPLSYGHKITAQNESFDLFGDLIIPSYYAGTGPYDAASNTDSGLTLVHFSLKFSGGGGGGGVQKQITFTPFNPGGDT